MSASTVTLPPVPVGQLPPADLAAEIATAFLQWTPVAAQQFVPAFQPTHRARPFDPLRRPEDFALVKAELERLGWDYRHTYHPTALSSDRHAFEISPRLNRHLIPTPDTSGILQVRAWGDTEALAGCRAVLVAVRRIQSLATPPSTP